jgi:diaminobutyrate-2-oxoglutarate transaminase
LTEKLQALQREVPQIGDVRGRGLMIGVEIVDGHGKTNALGQPLADPALASAIQRKCFQKGLILELGGRHGAVVRFLPPLIITEEQVNTVAGIFAEAVREAAFAPETISAAA